MREADAASRLTPAQQAAADRGHKALMPIGEQARPFLDFVLGEMADAGVTDIALVVGPGDDPVRAHYEARRLSRVRLTPVVQPCADGTARAVAAAEEFAGDDPFLVLNGDNLYPSAVLRALSDLGGPGLPAYPWRRLVEESGFPPARVGSFALLSVDACWRLTAIEEKPGVERLEAAGPGAMVSMNVWRFDRRIFGACRDVRCSPRGEYELPEAVALSIGRGVAYQVLPGAGAVVDLSGRADVDRVAAQLAGREPRL